MRVRPGARARWLSRTVQGGSGERGFSLIEVVVALAILAFVMAATAGLFINSLKRTNGQGARQVAVSLANQTMDRARGVATASLVAERPQSKVTALIAAAPAAVVLTDDDISAGNYDPSPTDSTGSSAAIPITQNVTINSQLYVIDTFVDQCYRDATTQVCGRTNNPAFTQLWRITVDVHWAPKGGAQGGCTNGRCDYVVSSLRDSTVDPTFNNNPGAGLPAPTISSISNVPVGYGTATLTVTGLAFVAGATVTVPTGGIVGSVTYVNPTLLYVVYTAPAVRPTSATETMDVTNPDGQLAIKNFSVSAAAAPHINSIAPTSVVAYSTTSSLTINGTGFQAGATVTVGGSTFTNVTPNGAGTQAVVGPYTAPINAGTVTVTWTNTDTQTDSDPLTVTAAPKAVITGFRDGSGATISSWPGYGSGTITIVGTGFQPGIGITVSGGASLTSVTYVNGTTATGTYTAPPSGSVTFTPTNTDGQVGTAGTLATSLAAPPTLTNVSPASIGGNGTKTFTLTGTNFHAGAAVIVTGGASAGTVTVLSATSISVVITAPSAAGSFNVSVRNTDLQTTSALPVTVNAAPTISGFTPTSLQKNRTNKPLTITGSGFVNGAVVTLSAGTLKSTTYNSSSQISITLDTPGATTMTVTVTNPDGGTTSATISVA